MIFFFQDGVVVVWHDEEIVPSKCRDTGPAVRNYLLMPFY